METSSKLNNLLRTWVEIDRKAIAANYQTFRSILSPGVRLAGVIKSNAYGHGLVDVGRELETLGADFLAVDSVVEGISLRRAGIKTPIVVLGMTLPLRMEEAGELDIAITISNFIQLEHATRIQASRHTDQKLAVHIKADTGMHRQGFLLTDIPYVLAELERHRDALDIAGLYTHFASAKDPNAPETTHAQLEEFAEWIRAFKEAGHAPIAHAAATGGTLLFPEAHFDMVRVGIGMYGLWPSAEARAARERDITLVPVLSWRSIIAEIKSLPKGAGIGYDLTEHLERDSLVAVVPIGYWHGYSRALSSTGEVLIHGVRAKVLGRIAMDMIVVDITDVPNTAVYDTVTLIGKDANDAISAEEVANKSATVSYEIVTRLNPRMKRKIV